jgi:hypothetical protein
VSYSSRWKQSDMGIFTLKVKECSKRKFKYIIIKKKLSYYSVTINQKCFQNQNVLLSLNTEVHLTKSEPYQYLLKIKSKHLKH